MALYHRLVHWPRDVAEQIAALPAIMRLIATDHAVERAQEKGVVIPTHLRTAAAEVVEAETDARGRVVKVLVRTTYAYRNDHDIVLAIGTRRGEVRTAWLNHRGDKHRWLDRSRYARS